MESAADLQAPDQSRVLSVIKSEVDEADVSSHGTIAA